MRKAKTILVRGGAAAGLALALACGGGKDARVFAVDPEPATVQVGETLPMAVVQSPDLAGEVEWDVKERYGGGLLQSHGPRVTYVAPEAAGTYHLVLRARGRDGSALKEEVEVLVLPSATLEPAAPRVQPGSVVQFRARMKGLAQNGATWAVEEADGGEVGPDGRYVAPRRPGIYHVTATSTVDPSAVARAAVTVGDE